MKRIFKLVLCFTFLYGNSQENVGDTLNRYDLNGRKTGKWTGHWTETNKFASVEYFAAGKRNGLCSYYNMNGYIIEESEYLSDSLNGISKTYSSVGTLKEIAEFRKGRREGLTKYYNYKKQLVEEMEYHNNIRNGAHRIFYTSGRVQMEGNFVNGKENGTRKMYKNNGRMEIILETDFVDDARIERRYYRRGRLIKVEKEASPQKEFRVEG
jgi:antitoxin component YwqK of YwqJK toxin-antitoxin module